MGLLVASIGACSMREKIELKLVGPQEFPRYVLIFGEEYYYGPNDRWGLFLHEALLFANLKKATTESLFLRDLAQLDRERLESEQKRHEENEWRRMSEEEENENDD
jgi:hypothetical protein